MIILIFFERCQIILKVLEKDEGDAGEEEKNL